MGDLVRTKQLSCRDAGGSCDFVAQAQTEDEVMEITLDHICQSHEMCEIISLETENRWKSLIKNVWVEDI